MMNNTTSDNTLFDRVVSILEQARGNVVRAVNTSMVTAYWLIGREIVQELQGGDERAEYGKQVVEKLAVALTRKYGKGFSAPTLWKFRQFYQVYYQRLEILSLTGTELGSEDILSPSGIELKRDASLLPAGSQLAIPFSPQLSWSHYRALMRVKDEKARDFYEQEAIEGAWSKDTLERQIHTQYYERVLKSQQPKELIADGRQLQKKPSLAIESLKNPYVLEFLGYPNFADLRESDIETAIISQLQQFLLELGNGFAFVGRQKHIRIEEEDRYIDLVFYNCKLKFYLLIDLKIGKLSHGDVGQMDGYVRMFDGLFTTPDDNPTIGLILCSEKSDTVARYSVLSDRKQIFASKYMLCLPTEEELQIEIERERRLIEEVLSEGGRDV
ncbi:MAG TPA: PDDEXK nuclease domain-containing protein [Treponemataceae bacterium]|nr:PDDEXK nuclease domain-containing protein [Treponemataceae bacterium]